MRRRMVSVAVGAAIVASPWIGPVGAKSVDPGSGSVAHVPVATITGALDALDALPSYRFLYDALSETLPPRPASVEGVIIRDGGWRAQVDSFSDGELVASIITIEDRSWLAGAGSGYVESDFPFTEEGDDLPFEARIRDMLGVDGQVDDLGEEVVEGTATRHLRLAGEVSDAAPEPELDGSDAYELPVHFLDAVLDIWVAEEDGRLVQAVVEGTRTVTEDLAAEPVVYQVQERTVISHVDDPANVIDEPGGPASPPPVASPDPAVVAMVERAYASFEALESYRIRIETTTSGYTLTFDVTIRNRPVAAGELAIHDVGGGFGMWTRIIEDRTWTRSAPDHPWSSADGGSGCSDETGEMQPCTVARLAQTGTTDLVPAGSFVRLADEVLEGVPVAHLRSESGSMVPRYGWVPGVTDLWISLDAGHLLRSTSDGQGTSDILTVSHVNDPTNVIEDPG